MKRKSGRVVLLLGLLLVIIIAAVAYLLLGQGAGGASLLGGAPPTATPEAKPVVKPVKLFIAGSYISSTEFFVTAITTSTLYQGDEWVRDPQQILGKVALVDLLENKPVSKRDLGEPGLAYKIDAGKRAMAIEVDLLSGLVGNLAVNDHVDVILSGVVDEYLPQQFPAAVEYVSPDGRTEFIPRPFPWVGEEPFSLLTVKTVIEDLRVLEIISLTAAAGPPNVTPTPGPAGRAAGYILILEVTMQQAEVLRFARDQGWPLQMTLRRYNERNPSHAADATTGVTTWILLDPAGNYRMPIGREIPYPITPGSLPPGTIP